MWHNWCTPSFTASLCLDAGQRLQVSVSFFFFPPSFAEIWARIGTRVDCCPLSLYFFFLCLWLCTLFSTSNRWMSWNNRNSVCLLEKKGRLLLTAYSSWLWRRQLVFLPFYLVSIMLSKWAEVILEGGVKTQQASYRWAVSRLPGSEMLRSHIMSRPHRKRTVEKRKGLKVYVTPCHWINLSTWSKSSTVKISSRIH